MNSRTKCFYKTFTNSYRQLVYSYRYNGTFISRKTSLDYKIYSSSNDKTKNQPIIVSHGLYGNKKEWDKICKELNSRTGRKVIAYDAVNHGSSSNHHSMTYRDTALDLVTLIEKLKIEKASFVGHRMGGKCAMTLALCLPEKISQLVVIDSYPSQNQSAFFKTKQALERLIKFDIKKYSSKVEALHEFQKLGLNQALCNALLANLLEINDNLKWSINLESVFNNYDELLSFPSFNRNVKYEGPALFINGSKELFVRKESYGIILDRFPSSDIYSIDNSTYWMHKEQPQALLDCMIPFLT